MRLSQAARAQIAHTRESVATDDEILAMARDFEARHGRWPSKRYRVDGTPFGNSRLLRRGLAETTQRSYGGHVRELIPPRAKAVAPGVNKCARCGARGHYAKTCAERRGAL